jgi:hypothetical protein
MELCPRNLKNEKKLKKNLVSQVQRNGKKFKTIYKTFFFGGGGIVCQTFNWFRPGLPDFSLTKYQNGKKYTK